MARRVTSVVLTCLIAAALASAPAAARRPQPMEVDVAVKHLGPDYDLSRYLPETPAVAGFSSSAGARLSAVKTPPLGTKRRWPALDDEKGTIYAKSFVLRGKGRRVEVWVATKAGLKFPEGDCRNDARTRITDAQVRYLVSEFDNNIYPKEVAAFAKPPNRDGTDSVAYRFFETVGRREHRGGGDNTVVLVDNVRDDVFYDTDNANDLPFIAGFFTPTFNALTDRNVMTIDSFDWRHRTGAEPPHEPTSSPCTNSPGKPFFYESTFAHEYEHLIETYSDPNELLWVDEGLAEWARSLTGYSFLDRPVPEPGFDSAVQCFLGNLSPSDPTASDGGPENSLTEWEDQTDPEEIVCDYGAALTFMEYVADRFGAGVLTALHRNEANGLEGLGAALATAGVAAQDVVRDWAAMVALDGVLDDGANLSGGDPANLTTASLDALVNWATPDAFSTPGAPPNGSDYVRARDAGGAFLGASQIETISFDGEETASLPLEWTIDPSPPGHANDAALYSGEAVSIDRSAIVEATVPPGDPKLRFETNYLIEPGFDFGFVRVSVDGGRTFRSLSNAHTVNETGRGALRAVKNKLPGLTGDSGGWSNETFDLSEFTGQNVHIEFRYISDPVTAGPGWWIDDVSVGGSTLFDGSDVSVFRSPTEVNPFTVAGWTVQLIAYDDARSDARIARLTLDAAHAGALSGPALDAVIGTGAQTVGIVVMQDDPTETVPAYARYELVVDGVTQPGG